MQTFEFTLVVAIVLVVLYVGYIIGRFVSRSRFKSQIPQLRETAIKQSRSVLSGQFSEQIAPYLPKFEYKPTELRFIGKPIDFIAFKGMDEHKIEEIVFIEVKTGQSKLSDVQKSLKKAVEDKKVSWKEYKADKN